jgi:hypothetical protein
LIHPLVVQWLAVAPPHTERSIAEASNELQVTGGRGGERGRERESEREREGEGERERERERERRGGERERERERRWVRLELFVETRNSTEHFRPSSCTHP